MMYRLAKVLFLLSTVMWFRSLSAKAQTIVFFKYDSLGKQSVYDTIGKVSIPYNEKDTVISNKHIIEAKQDFLDYNGIPIVSISLTNEGRIQLAKATKASIGKPIIIMIDGELIAAPMVRSKTVGGQVAISGGFDISQAKLLADALNSVGVTRKIKLESELKRTTRYLEYALVEKNYDILNNFLDDNLLMGHSNGYFQNKEVLLDDLKQEKIIYESFEQIGDFEVDIFQSGIRLNRKVEVAGKYKGEKFEMKLAVMEIWKETKNGLKLWSRQAVKIKD